MKCRYQYDIYFIYNIKGGLKMEEIINIISNQGVAIGVVIYLIYFQNTTMKEMLTTLSSMNARLSDIENKIGINHGKSNT